MIRPIIQYPDEALRKVSQPLAQLDPNSLRLAGDLIDTMHKYHAYGLSAIQVGIPVRMFAISPRTQCPYKVLINPSIMAYSPKTTMSKEGCLSIKKGAQEFIVRRSVGIKVRAIVRPGNWVEMDVVGGAALVMQHEIDHLDGKLVLDFAQLLRA